MPHKFFDTKNPATRRDPTGTTPIRRKFEREATRRFRMLKGLVRRVVLDMDVLALDSVTTDNLEFARIYGGSADRSRAFAEWLREAASETVIGGSRGRRTSEEDAWTKAPVTAAYRKGGGDATAMLKMGGKNAHDFSFMNSLHNHAVQVLQKRAYDSMVNVRDTTVQQMLRILAGGLQSGLGKGQIANLLLDRIDKIGITRARTVASFETVAAFNEAALNCYELAGVLRVGVQPESIRGVHDHQEVHDHQHLHDAKRRKKKKPEEYAPQPDYGPGIYKRGPKKGEPKPTKQWPKGRWPLVAWATAADDFVCPECAALEDQVFTLVTARNMLPLHPNCRCALYPLIEEE